MTVSKSVMDAAIAEVMPGSSGTATVVGDSEVDEEVLDASEARQALGNEDDQLGDQTEGNSTEEAGEADLSQESGTEDNDSEDTQTSESSAKSSPDVEEIAVSDEQGRRKIRIDWNDREKIKKYVSMAYGARKWQAERDQVRGELQTMKPKFEELQTNWSAVEEAYKADGVAGLVNLIEGKPDAYRDYERKILERYETRKVATPEELDLMDARDREDRIQRELERIRKENEEIRTGVQKDRERAELAQLEAQVHPAFDKFRFAGRLGNADDEHMFDEMLWNTTLKRLQPYEESGKLTAARIESEFRAVASKLRQRMQVQAEKQVAKAVEARKEQATANVQMKAMKGVGQSQQDKDINSLTPDGLSKFFRRYGFGK
jgi:hypothetical protein